MKILIQVVEGRPTPPQGSLETPGSFKVFCRDQKAVAGAALPGEGPTTVYCDGIMTRCELFDDKGEAVSVRMWMFCSPKGVSGNL